jgi:predicted RNase H-like nuclease
MPEVSIGGTDVYEDSGVKIAGVDLAWQTDRNSSGIAIGSLESGVLVVQEARFLSSLQAVLDGLNAYPNLVGVAIDAPLIDHSKCLRSTRV